MRIKTIDIDRIVGAILLVISIALFLINRTYPEYSQGYTGLLLILLGLCSLDLMICKQNHKIENMKLKNSRVFILLIAFTLYIILIIVIGYFPASIVFMCGLLILFGLRDWKKILITNVFFIVLVYFLFIFFLRLKLPIGIIFEG